MARMGYRTAWLLTVMLLIAALAGCSGEDASPSPDAQTSAPSSTEPTSTDVTGPGPAGPTYLPAGELPNPLRLKDVGARTVKAEPFADFAVAVSGGVWVSGVSPGAVRYDDAAGGSITARARISGEVVQALEATTSGVFVPVWDPALLLRLDAATGDVRARVKLPGRPISEATVGADGDTGYVLIDASKPRIAVIEGDRVVEEIPAPEGATAVRAGFGSLWIPTSNHTVERYSLESKEWTTIAVGPAPRFLDVGFAAVWVMNQGDGSVTRIDARSGRTEALPVTGVPIGGGDLTLGAGAVWLRTDRQVARIDPESRTVTHLIDLPPGSASAAAADGLLVVSNHDHEAVHLVPLPLPR